MWIGTREAMNTNNLTWLDEIERRNADENAGYLLYVRSEILRLTHTIRDLYSVLASLRIAAEAVIMAHDEAASGGDPNTVRQALRALKRAVIQASLAEAKWSGGDERGVGD